MIRKKTEPQEGQQELRQALLFELENIAVDGRKLIYGAIQKILDTKGIKVKDYTFSRYALNASLKEFVTTVVEVNKKHLSVDKLVDELESRIGTDLLKNSSSVKGGVQKLLKRASERNVSVGALSALHEPVAKELVEKLRLSDTTQALLCSNNGCRLSHSADSWLKLARNMSARPSRCLVLASSRTSCKSALKVGMRCVAVPDSYTSFQDFGGADMVTDEFSSGDIDRIFELLDNE